MNVNSEDGEENRRACSRTEECQSSSNIKQSRRKPTRQLCHSVWNMKSLMSLQSMLGMF